MDTKTLELLDQLKTEWSAQMEKAEKTANEQIEMKILLKGALQAVDIIKQLLNKPAEVVPESKDPV